MINWPQVLVDDIARRKCVIFLGAGVSKNSRNHEGRIPKNWLEFLSDAIKHVPNGSAKNFPIN